MVALSKAERRRDDGGAWVGTVSADDSDGLDYIPEYLGTLGLDAALSVNDSWAVRTVPVPPI